MGLRDAIKSLKGDGGGAAGGEVDISSLPSEGADAETFAPLQNGTYVGGPDAGGPHYLRFHATGKVYLASGPATAADARPLLGPTNSDPWVGQYTAAGRFSLVRRFERPIVCTVLTTDDSGFVARVTSTAIGAGSSEGRFDFQVDPE